MDVGGIEGARSGGAFRAGVVWRHDYGQIVKTKREEI